MCTLYKHEDVLLQPVEATADEVSELQMDEKTSENIFSELSVEDVKEVIESVAKEMLGGLQVYIPEAWGHL